jgi:hypothetical protein
MQTAGRRRRKGYAEGIPKKKISIWFLNGVRRGKEMTRHFSCLLGSFGIPFA